MAGSKHALDHLFLAADDPARQRVPWIDASKYVLDGELVTWPGPFRPIYSPICSQSADTPDIELGKYPMMDAEAGMVSLHSAIRAYNHGRDRIKAMQQFVAGLKQRRDTIVQLIIWEICKTPSDAEKEVDRTIQYIEDTIAVLFKFEAEQSILETSGGVTAQVRRAPYGVVLCAGPFNYPFNETYTTMIPALLMGNAVLLKLPRTGNLCHWPTFELFVQCFPRGVINVICGSGRETMTPIMRSGKVDILAFIGSSRAADSLQSAHPKPHRLRVCLGLEAKNPAIILEDADLDVAVEQCLLGSLSYNGQRCTAIKIIFVHKSVEDLFLQKFVAAVEAIRVGLPWQPNVKITPLPEEGQPGYMRDLLSDAVAKGARVLNKDGGRQDRSFVTPAVIFPVTTEMRIYHEEQFGPLVPVRSWSHPDEVLDYLATSPYGQQASLFSRDPSTTGRFIDALVTQVSRVNLNTQCQRGPDHLPFTGRKDSAFGTLSLHDALRVFSLRALVAAQTTPANTQLIGSILQEKHSNFLRDA